MSRLPLRCEPLPKPEITAYVYPLNLSWHALRLPRRSGDLVYNAGDDWVLNIVAKPRYHSIHILQDPVYLSDPSTIAHNWSYTKSQFMLI